MGNSFAGRVQELKGIVTRTKDIAKIEQQRDLTRQNIDDMLRQQEQGGYRMRLGYWTTNEFWG